MESPTEYLSFDLSQRGSIRTVTGSSTSIGSHVAIPMGPTAGGTTRTPRSSRTMKCINPADVERYMRKIVIKPRKGSLEIKSMTRKFEGELLPDDWVACAHPEGALYFHNTSKNIFTEAYLYDQEMFELVTSFAEELRDSLRSIGESLTGLELVVEVFQDVNDELVCGYYLADNEARALLWLEPYDAEDMLWEFEGETSMTHLKVEMESRYWTHCELFPNHRDVPDEILNELMGIMMHSSIDAMTSELSLSIYSPQETRDMLDLVERVRTIGRANGASACVVGRLFSLYGHNRFLHNFGQHGARLASDQSIYGRNIHPPRSYLLKMFSVLLFSAPNGYLKSLEETWLDRTLKYSAWKDLMMRLFGEREQLLLLSTVMLTANVSFLAIQSVDQGDSYRSPAQIASYFSMIASIGSIIFGLLLVRKGMSLTREVAAVTGAYLLSDFNRRMEILSIIYALPYGLFMWAMTLFLLAFSFTTFELDVLFHSTGLGLRLFLAMSWAAIFALLVWFILPDRDGMGKNIVLTFFQWKFPESWTMQCWRRSKEVPSPTSAIV
ncbi:hypothetical protein JAAARDRAFT_183926 [Jaapia argillacea MUCL 33604]|uniref:WW domain-containing protein n=1 Tax=Jaapia argillacea MUCL 33604 TaxID=933084 RepID=A0A067PMX8_9AGAM|nr:hypothetical protein JAAARDRAFT_183926 [Jaapia argillacea MUCL 33604]